MSTKLSALTAVGLSACLSGAVLVGTTFASAQAAAQPVTTDMLENAQALSDRWIHYGKNYGAWRYMPDDLINRDTVNRLAPKWI